MRVIMIKIKSQRARKVIHIYSVTELLNRVCQFLCIYCYIYCYHCNTYLLCLIIVGYTLPIMSMCIECGNKFRTYKTGKDCLLPNGNVECHQEPQLKCPDCDCGYGLHMNQDLFPHLLLIMLLVNYI